MRRALGWFLFFLPPGLIFGYVLWIAVDVLGWLRLLAIFGAGAAILACTYAGVYLMDEKR